MKKWLFLFFGFLFFSPAVVAHPSWGIVVDKDRNIYFADILNNGMGSVWKLTKQGKLILLLRNFHAHNVSLDRNGNLVTSHGENNHTMIRMHNNGSTDTLFHVLNYKDFFGGNATYSPSGEIVFGTDKHIWRINPKGQKEKVSEHQFSWNQTVYVDDEGNYYGPDIGEGGGQVVKITPSGQATILATNLISILDRPLDLHNDILMGITKGCDGHLYIAEIAGQRILKILGDQKTEVFYTAQGDWFPTGIYFFSGDAYILEYKAKGDLKGPRIIKVNEVGEKTVLFNYNNFPKNKITPHVMPGKTNQNWLLYAIIGLVLLVLIPTILRLYTKRFT